MVTIPELSSCQWWIYILITGLGSTFVRLINSMWRSLESHEPSWERFKGVFKGCGWKVREEQKDNSTGETKAIEKRTAADYWQPFFIGWLELISYPVLIFSDKASFIGAWLAFKTVHRWSYAPGVNRGFYNRYLLSNALILIASYVLARLMFC